MTKVVIVVEGGNVQEVLTDDASVEVCLIDYDNEPDIETSVYLSSFEQAHIGGIDDEIKLSR